MDYQQHNPHHHAAAAAASKYPLGTVPSAASSAAAAPGSRLPGGWRRHLLQVDWTCVVLIVVLGIGTAVVSRRAPVMRPIYVGDATIAYPHVQNSVPFWLAVVLPIVLLLGSAALLEFHVLRGRQSRRQAALTLLNVLLAVLAALAVTGFLTELFKRMCGRLRPDFLARCQPAPLPAGANPVPYGTRPPVTCTAPWGPELEDGHMSFPSGHSSCSMVTGLFAALYTLWSLHWRCAGPDADLLSPAAAQCAASGGWSWGVWARQEALRLAVTLLVLLEAAWPWGVAVSRFIDSRHNVSDIVGGLLLGACFAPLFVARLACHASAWAGIEARQQQQLRLQYSAASSPNSNAVLPIVAPGTITSSAGGHVTMASMH